MHFFLLQISNKTNSYEEGGVVWCTYYHDSLLPISGAQGIKIMHPSVISAIPTIKTVIRSDSSLEHPRPDSQQYFPPYQTPHISAEDPANQLPLEENYGGLYHL